MEGNTNASMRSRRIYSTNEDRVNIDPHGRRLHGLNHHAIIAPAARQLHTPFRVEPWGDNENSPWQSPETSAPPIRLRSGQETHAREK